MNRLESVVLISDSQAGMAKSPSLAEEDEERDNEGEDASYRMNGKQRRGREVGL